LGGRILEDRGGRMAFCNVPAHEAEVREATGLTMF
jgi:hypothetical protein